MKQAVEERVKAEEALKRTERQDREVEEASLAMWTHMAENNFGPRILREMKRRR